MASMRPRTRKDGSVFWEVLFRHDGRQRSLSFETAEHGQRIRDPRRPDRPGQGAGGLPQLQLDALHEAGATRASPTMV